MTTKAEELAALVKARKVEPIASPNAPAETALFQFKVPELSIVPTSTKTATAPSTSLQPESPAIPPEKSQERLNVESQLQGMDQPATVPRGKMEILNNLLRGASYGAMDPAKVMALQQNQQQIEQTGQMEKRRALVEQLQQMRAGEQQNTQNALAKAQNERATAQEARTAAAFPGQQEQEAIQTEAMRQKMNEPQMLDVARGGKLFIRYADGTEKEITNPAEPPAKSLQSIEVELKDGSHQVANYDPGAGNYFSPTGEDITAQVKSRYQRPSSMINAGIGYNDLDAAAKARVDAVKDKVAAGEYTIQAGLSALGGVRGNLGGALTEALTETRVLPTKIREENTNIERAKNLLVPVHRLVDEINKTVDLKQKAIRSAQLEQYVQAIGTQFARARGERGVVTDQDVNRVLGLIPGWKSANFAPEYAQSNLKLVEEAFARDQQALLGKYFTTYEKGGAGPTALDDALDKAFGKPITPKGKP